MQEFKHLSEQFIKAMNDIGEHGFKKHGKNSFQYQLSQGNLTRTIPRHTTKEIMEHARTHTHQYENGELHDHFGDLLHQLAAVAFNAMVEAQYAGLVHDQPPKD